MLCVALSALLVPGTALPALPPASVGSSSQDGPANPPAKVTPSPGAAGVPGEAGEDAEEIPWWQQIGFVGPRYAWYGSVGYEWLSNTAENSTTRSQGLNSMLGARFSSFIWQPWFGRLTGDLRTSMGRTSAGGDETFGQSGGSKSLMWTGSTRLALMHRSRFPFEAFVERNYNRVTAEFSPLAGSTLMQRLGLVQSYTHENGANATMEWTRSTQSGNSDFGDVVSDTLMLNMAHRLTEHNMSGAVSRMTTKQEGFASNSVQNNFSLTHSYTPEDAYYTIDSNANLHKSAFQFEDVSSDARLSQLATVVNWRPEEEPYFVVGTVRVLGLETEVIENRMREQEGKRTTDSVNLSLGLTYNLGQYTHATGSINANSYTINGTRLVTTNQMVSISHSPERIPLGGFDYRWMTSAGLSNTTGGAGAGQSDNGTKQLSLQLSHHLNRTFELENDSRVVLSASQAISAAVNSRRRNYQDNPEGALLQLQERDSKRVTHNVGASWSLNEGTANGVVHASASDSRSLGGIAETFQLVNLQFTGNLQTGSTSSWSGNISIQAIKQDTPQLPGITIRRPDMEDVKVTSNGSISYRQSRLFGIRRLNLNSSVRLTSTAMLPMLGGPSDYETAAWDTRVDYVIGRLTLRAYALISKSVIPVVKRTTDGFELQEGEPKINKSIMFTVTRHFGS